MEIYRLNNERRTLMPGGENYTYMYVSMWARKGISMNQRLHRRK